MEGVNLFRFDRTIDLISHSLPTSLSSTDLPVFCSPEHEEYMRGLILMEGVDIKLYVLKPGKHYELGPLRYAGTDMPRFYTIGIHPSELYWDVGHMGYVGMDNKLPPI